MKIGMRFPISPGEIPNPPQKKLNADELPCPSWDLFLMMLCPRASCASATLNMIIRKDLKCHFQNFRTCARRLEFWERGPILRWQTVIGTPTSIRLELRVICLYKFHNHQRLFQHLFLHQLVTWRCQALNNWWRKDRSLQRKQQNFCRPWSHCAAQTRTDIPMASIMNTSC